MIYYKIPFSTEFSYPSGCVLCRAYPDGGYMLCEFDSVPSVGSDWVEITQDLFYENCPEYSAVPYTVHEVIATSAALESGSIVLDLPASVDTGTIVKFTAPCACDQVSGGLVIDGDNYAVVDAMGDIVTGVGGVWDIGAQVSVLIDKINSKAFVQNSAKAKPETHASTHASGGSDPITPESIGAAPAYTYGTEDLTAGTSTLETGKLYFVYE